MHINLGCRIEIACPGTYAWPCIYRIFKILWKLTIENVSCKEASINVLYSRHDWCCRRLMQRYFVFYLFWASLKRNAWPPSKVSIETINTIDAHEWLHKTNQDAILESEHKKYNLNFSIFKSHPYKSWKTWTKWKLKGHWFNLQPTYLLVLRILKDIELNTVRFLLMLMKQFERRFSRKSEKVRKGQMKVVRITDRIILYGPISSKGP